MSQLQGGAAEIERSNQIQARFTAVMLVVAAVLLAVITMQPVGGRGGVSLQMVIAFGTFLAAVGLAVAVWRRRVLLWVTSALLLMVGTACLAWLTVLPQPNLDPMLSSTGEWSQGPIPLHLGWSRLAMAATLVAAAIALPFTQSKHNLRSLLSLSLVRLCIWIGAFWEIGYWILEGHFDRLFAGWAGVMQILLLMALCLATFVLTRGDRRWLATLTPADQSVSMARFILPMTLAPELGAYFTRVGVKFGALDTDIARLLNIEIVSISLLIFGTAILRSLWGERHVRDQLARALEQSPVIVYSEKGLIEYWPRACEELYGFTAAEAIGQRSDTLLRTQFPLSLEDLETTLRRDGQWSGEVRQTTRAGKRLWIASRLVASQHPDDAAPRIVETLTDITALKTTSEALHATTENLTQAVGAYELGIIEFDAKTDQTTVSKEFEAIAGVPTGSMGSARRNWRSLLTPPEAERIATQLIDDVTNHASRRVVTTQIRRGDGETRDVYGMLRYRYGADGGLRRIVGVFMDVTEQLRDRAELAEGNARLMELQSELTHVSRLSAMGEMAAALAHELNQPLTAVGNSVGAIELLLADGSKPVDEARRQRVLRAAKHADSQAVRAGEIVRRLRGFIARGETDSRSEDLRALIDDAIALALPNPSSAQVSLRTSVAPEAACVLADRIQIQQVIVNLVRNAVESMRHQSSPRILSIGVTAEEGMALVRVKDSGPGVAREMLEGLFAPFMSTKRDGMGVGLSICRRIVEAHGGRMWLEPSEEGGADFRFTLPLFPREDMDEQV